MLTYVHANIQGGQAHVNIKCTGWLSVWLTSKIQGGQTNVILNIKSGLSLVNVKFIGKKRTLTQKLV